MKKITGKYPITYKALELKYKEIHNTIDNTILIFRFTDGRKATYAVIKDDAQLISEQQKVTVGNRHFIFLFEKAMLRKVTKATFRAGKNIYLQNADNLRQNQILSADTTYNRKQGQ